MFSGKIFGLDFFYKHYLFGLVLEFLLLSNSFKLELRYILSNFIFYTLNSVMNTVKNITTVPFFNNLRNILESLHNKKHDFSSFLSNTKNQILIEIKRKKKSWLKF